MIVRQHALSAGASPVDCFSGSVFLIFQKKLEIQSFSRTILILNTNSKYTYSMYYGLNIILSHFQYGQLIQNFNDYYAVKHNTSMNKT